MPVGWGWRLTAPANSSGTKGQIWWQPHTSHLANCAQLSQELRLVSRGDSSSMPSDCLREPRWGGQKFPAARFVQSRHSPLREERRGLWLKVWCLRCWFPFLPLPRFCSRQVARNPRAALEQTPRSYRSPPPRSAPGLAGPTLSKLLGLLW